MKPTNRIRSLTRWPDNPAEVYQLANMDIEFCLVMGKVFYPHLQGAILREHARIWDKAWKQLGVIETWN